MYHHETRVKVWIWGILVSWPNIFNQLKMSPLNIFVSRNISNFQFKYRGAIFSIAGPPNYSKDKFQAPLVCWRRQFCHAVALYSCYFLFQILPMLLQIEVVALVWTKVLSALFLQCQCQQGHLGTWVCICLFDAWVAFILHYCSNDNLKWSCDLWCSLTKNSKS